MERFKDWLTNLWHRIFPWRIVRRERWDDLVAVSEDLLKQNWELAGEVSRLTKPRRITTRKKTT